MWKNGMRAITLLWKTSSFQLQLAYFDWWKCPCFQILIKVRGPMHGLRQSWILSIHRQNKQRTAPQRCSRCLQGAFWMNWKTNVLQMVLVATHGLGEWTMHTAGMCLCVKNSPKDGHRNYKKTKLGRKSLAYTLLCLYEMTYSYFYYQIKYNFTFVWCLSRMTFDTG